MNGSLCTPHSLKEGGENIQRSEGFKPGDPTLERILMPPGDLVGRQILIQLVWSGA